MDDLELKQTIVVQDRLIARLQDRDERRTRTMGVLVLITIFLSLTHILAFLWRVLT